ncbi:MAG: hypothetical protein VR65_28800 [Desulfobulbaceae bacterium BRH_c16a]|nr:MAG: hypothetical protein VR65_28800 [Desulfobulbaceae bacterium BRH_c16a]
MRELEDRCVGYQSVVHMKSSAFSEEYSFFCKNRDLPLLRLEGNYFENPEICFLVEGLTRNSEIKSSPLSSEKFFKVLTELSSRYEKKYSIVLGEIPKAESLPSSMEDFICFHLPIQKATIEVDYRREILRLYMVPIDERRGHLHYGNSGDPTTERVLHKTLSGVI